ncbi:MAG: prephenate dehydratase [Nitrososphaerota archaeon]|nr:prephenate dehydratase [Nitrososphaerota archaeon]
MKVSFQGERGAYSEEAAIAYFPSGVSLLPKPFLADVFRSAENGDSDFAVVPVENSLEGSVNETYDLLLDSNLSIIGEIVHRVNHCLMALPGQTLKDIREVWSHPQALSQCRKFIQAGGFVPVSLYDTAGSAKLLAERKATGCAAIASQRAAKYYGLKIIKRGIEDSVNNYTRFFVMSRREVEGEYLAQVKYKTSIIYSVKHMPGSLYSSLGVFAKNGVNLTKIESRPTRSTPWEYYFFVDFEGHVKMENIKKTLEELERQAIFIKVLGSYKRGEIL